MTFKLYRAGTARYAPETSSRRRIRFGSPLILVVEDHEDSRLMLKTLLEIRGFKVVVAEDGLTAIEIAARVYPDLIMMDASLPRLDGLEAVRRLRQNESIRGVPIVALSGHTTPEFQAAALAAGCNDFLTKPIDFDHLDDLINRLLPADPHSA